MAGPEWIWSSEKTHGQFGREINPGPYVNFRSVSLVKGPSRVTAL